MKKMMKSTKYNKLGFYLKLSMNILIKLISGEISLQSVGVLFGSSCNNILRKGRNVSMY